MAKTNEPCFVKNATIDAFLGADGTWYKKNIILSNPSVLCRFENIKKAQLAAARFQVKGVLINACKSGVLRKYLGLTEPAWGTFLSQVLVGLHIQRAEEQAVSAESALNPPVMEPTDSPFVPHIPAIEPDTIEDSYLEPVHSSDAVAKEVNETLLIQETVDVLQRLQKVSLKWDDVARNHEGRLKKAEKLLQDEMHFIEFMNLDVQRAYRSYRRMHDLRVRRRQIKNEMSVVECIWTMLHTTPELLVEGSAKVLHFIAGLNERKYQPRASWPVEDDTVNYPQQNYR